jgi:hypothetical protein
VQHHANIHRRQPNSWQTARDTQATSISGIMLQCCVLATWSTSLSMGIALAQACISGCRYWRYQRPQANHHASAHPAASGVFSAGQGHISWAARALAATPNVANSVAWPKHKQLPRDSVACNQSMRISTATRRTMLYSAHVSQPHTMRFAGVDKMLVTFSRWWILVARTSLQKLQTTATQHASLYNLENLGQ